VRLGLSGAETMNLQNADAWLDLLMSHYIESDLGKGSIHFIYDYPASQASLAKVREGDPPLAERFELYMDGVELANGFHELADANEQRSRFLSDLEHRRENGIKQVPMDENLLSALESGIPDCSGVALGIDRLLMRLTGSDHIRKVLAFPLGLA
jgi:lysyl-tRNA synthetase class 2